MSANPLVPIVDQLLALGLRLRGFEGEFESTEALHADLLLAAHQLMHIALHGPQAAPYEASAPQAKQAIHLSQCGGATAPCRTTASRNPDASSRPADLPATAIQTVKAIHVELARAEAFLTYIHRHLLRLEAQLHAAPAAGPTAPPASPPPADGGV